MSEPTSEVLIPVQATPNPTAWKFVLDRPVLTEGKMSFSTPKEAEGIPLALDLLFVEGVRQVHFFANVITVSHRIDIDPEVLQGEVCALIQRRMPVHNPDVSKLDTKKAQRQQLSPELQKIEEILNRTIRPGLQGDGGDLEVVRFEANRLFVTYQGACGSCPSSTTGTLQAIEGILRDEFDPNIEVVPL